MADLLAEFTVELIKLILACTFEPCHSQRGCVLSLITLISLVTAVGFFVAACAFGNGQSEDACGAIALTSAAVFVVGGSVMVWVKCVDEPRER
jgi:hypothetical protein